MQARVDGNKIIVEMDKEEALLLEKGLKQALDWMRFEGDGEVDDLHWELYKIFYGV